MANSFWAKPPIAIAHRGGGAVFGKEKYRKENTLEAFNRTVALGYGYLELDVIATSDNEVVVIHVARNKLDELFYGKKEAPTYQGLQKLTHQQLSKKMNREIPTLKTVLRTFPKTKFFIDAKTNRVVEPLCALIQKLRVQDRVCAGSFAYRRVIEIQALLGPKANTRLNISISPIAMFNQWRFVHSNKNISAVDLHYFYSRRFTIDYFHKRGLKVLTWTPNTEEQITRCAKLGVDGIMTDDPKLLLKVLESKGTMTRSAE